MKIKYTFSILIIAMLLLTSCSKFKISELVFNQPGNDIDKDFIIETSAIKRENFTIEDFSVYKILKNQDKTSLTKKLVNIFAMENTRTSNFGNETKISGNEKHLTIFDDHNFFYNYYPEGYENIEIKMSDEEVQKKLYHS